MRLLVLVLTGCLVQDAPAPSGPGERHLEPGSSMSQPPPPPPGDATHGPGLRRGALVEDRLAPILGDPLRFNGEAIQDLLTGLGAPWAVVVHGGKATWWNRVDGTVGKDLEGADASFHGVAADGRVISVRQHDLVAWEPGEAKGHALAPVERGEATGIAVAPSGARMLLLGSKPRVIDLAGKETWAATETVSAAGWLGDRVQVVAAGQVTEVHPVTGQATVLGALPAGSGEGRWHVGGDGSFAWETGDVLTVFPPGTVGATKAPPSKTLALPPGPRTLRWMDSHRVIVMSADGLYLFDRYRPESAGKDLVGEGSETARVLLGTGA